MGKYEVEIYETETGNSPFKKYMQQLGKKNQERDLAQIREYVKRLEEYGMAVNNEYANTIRQLQDDIYELRPPDHRVVFFYFDGKTIVLLHAFKKQRGKAPKSEIKTAKNEMKDYLRRHKNG